MSAKESALYVIADHPTPKIDMGVAFSLRSRDYKAPPIICSIGGVYRKTGHPRNAQEAQGWEETEVSDTLNIFDNSDGRTPILIVQGVKEDGCDMEGFRKPSAG